MSVSLFQELLQSITERGRALLEKTGNAAGSGDLQSDCEHLLSGHGEASGVAIASEILNRYRQSSEDEKSAFFKMLADTFAIDDTALDSAYQTYRQAPTLNSFRQLFAACEPPRQELFRRLNLAPGGTAALVAMRRDLLLRLRDDPALAAVDFDLVHLLGSWFNRGFLVMRRIDWSTPAVILEKIIRYEAVHEIQDWEELRRRIEPADRRCFGFFHPSMPDEPLIFVQVALTDHIARSIRSILDRERSETRTLRPTHAVFYSISNCQQGLRGISLGNFLIKQVAEDLTREIPSLKTFVTLSPVPGFSRWLQETSENTALLASLADPDWHRKPESTQALEKQLIPLVARYLLTAKRADGLPLDPVARFHLGNGARLQRINWLADASPKGLRQAAGLMVNYLYDLDYIEENHEMFANHGTIAASGSVRRSAKVAAKEQL